VRPSLSSAIHGRSEVKSRHAGCGERGTDNEAKPMPTPRFPVLPISALTPVHHRELHLPRTPLPPRTRRPAQIRQSIGELRRLESFGVKLCDRVDVPRRDGHAAYNKTRVSKKYPSSSG
jgi:hypothetical protein